MTDSKKARIGVWDLPTRIFHWLLVALIFCAWASFQYSEMVGDTSLFWHRMNGYAILVLILWRLMWGIIGSPASRFANFLVWPWTAARYGLDLMRRRDRRYLGHNPLGSYMILALLALVSLQGVLGLFSTEHNYVTWGPLSNLVSESTSEELTKYHVWLFENVLLVFIAAHVIANVLYRLIKKDQLIEAMVIGTKPVADYEDAARIIANGKEELSTDIAQAYGVPGGTIVRALLCLVLAVAVFAGAITSLGGKLFY